MKTIIFLHGFFASGSCVPASVLKEAFHNRVRVLTPDLPIHPKDALEFIKKLCRDENPDKTDEELAELLPKYVNKKEDGNIGYDKEKIVDFEKNTYIKSKEAL